MNPIHDPQDEHLVAEDLAALLAGDVSARERERLEAHLAECSICCDEFVDMARIERERKRARRGRQGRALIPVALGLIGVAVLVARPTFDRDEGPSFRASDSPAFVAAEPLAARAPDDAAEVPRDSLVFVWRPVEPDAFYTITLTDDRARPVWRGATRDTLIMIEDDVDLARGARYLWSVTALLSTGESIAMDEVRRLRIR